MNHNKQNVSASQRTRRGAVIIMVLVCLGVATALILTGVQISLRQQRQLRDELRIEQTRWLLDAGVSHAIAEWNSAPGKYAGETIVIDGGLKAADQATVKITLERESDSDSIAVLVEARLEVSGEPISGTLRSLEFKL